MHHTAAHSIRCWPQMGCVHSSSILDSIVQEHFVHLLLSWCWLWVAILLYVLLYTHTFNRVTHTHIHKRDSAIVSHATHTHLKLGQCHLTTLHSCSYSTVKAGVSLLQARQCLYSPAQGVPHILCTLTHLSSIPWSMTWAALRKPLANVSMAPTPR